MKINGKKKTADADDGRETKRDERGTDRPPVLFYRYSSIILPRAIIALHRYCLFRIVFRTIRFVAFKCWTTIHHYHICRGAFQTSAIRMPLFHLYLFHIVRCSVQYGLFHWFFQKRTISENSEFNIKVCVKLQKTLVINFL